MILNKISRKFILGVIPGLKYYSLECCQSYLHVLEIFLIFVFSVLLKYMTIFQESTCPRTPSRHKRSNNRNKKPTPDSAKKVRCIQIKPLCPKGHGQHWCWLIMSEVLWHSPEGNFTGNVQISILDINLNLADLRLRLHLPGTKEFMWSFGKQTFTVKSLI